MARVDSTAELIATLEPETAAIATAIISTLRHFGIPAVIVALGARRSLAEQQDLVSRGLSKDPASPHTRGEAFDLDLWGVNRDWIPRWFWYVVGPWVERSFPMKWGGHFGDWGHFEKRPGFRIPEL